MKPRKLIIATCCLALGACATSPAQKSAPAGATICEDPRPQVCTMDYRPVCASLQDGSEKTYSNGCGACADSAVSAWVDGACPE